VGERRGLWRSASYSGLSGVMTSPAMWCLS
jgi:hypothetical protein